MDHSAHFDVKIIHIGLGLTEFHSTRESLFLSQTFGIISHKNYRMQKAMLDLGPESVDISMVRQKSCAKASSDVHISSREFFKAAVSID